MLTSLQDKPTIFSDTSSRSLIPYLDERSFFIAGITQNVTFSTNVYKALVKAHIILLVPSASTSSSSNAKPAGDQMTVNTAAIGKRFVSQLAVISVHAQRKLVGMLFFWEEECMRWKLLDAEERKIPSALDTNAGNADLAVAMEAVEMKKKDAAKSEGGGDC